MRISADDRAATRQRILDSARRLFREKGFQQATTRDIAQAVGIASGTMFNYFATKEAIVVELALLAFSSAARDFAKHRRRGAHLNEDVFALMAAQLRHLRPLRKFIRPMLDTVFHPASARPLHAAATLRSDLGEQVANLLAEHGVDEPSPLVLNIFWSLYVGTLSFWEQDTSPKQEDTRALMDQSWHMFADWVQQHNSL